MPKQKFIDIDSIDIEIGTCRIGGVDYSVHQMSVKAYLNLIAMSENADKEEPNPGEYIRRMADSLKEMIPDCPLDKFLELSLEQIQALMVWTRELAHKPDEEDLKNVETPPPEQS